jgi:uncharacterized membrane protein YeaQ/YmgE (transglycosylase-associated protein family)
MNNNEKKDFIAYEYLSLNVENEKEPLYVDCYENFGWQPIISTALVDKEDYYINHSNTNEKKLINIKFKRDRRIKNKNELLSLQIKMENALNEINRLEHEPNKSGMIYSMITGVIGTVFLGFSTFAITATNPLIVPCIIFGVIGIVGWILPYFVYNKVRNKKKNENISPIEEQYNIVYDSCEQAKKLVD